MATKTIYKKISLEQSQNRNMVVLDTERKNKAKTIVSNFIQYLKNAHS